MSYIERNLLANETIIFRTKKHFIIFAMPIFWLIVTVLFYVYLNPFLKNVAMIPGIVLLVTGSFKFLEYYFSEYVVTNQRIMMREGFFFRRTNDMLLKTISNITVNQSLLGQLLDYGTLNINPFGGKDEIFTEISAPISFQKQTQQQLVNAR